MAGFGVGANVLIGGSEQSFQLRPLSTPTLTVLILALGVNRSELRSGNNSCPGRDRSMSATV
ncbi:DUF992 domain-containing protein [Aquibium carbonis]|uniref:DUF992 domain-containing protein n=1 Tax=Aquibium carbonis TaxID=2495581 RepID=A0A429YWF5_9HYPH|nr:DUF992 domain-containing protein [Aquibium carbonis]RST85799.1 DUF992 domain-containing protein [Aquibium carbonis]